MRCALRALVLLGLAVFGALLTRWADGVPLP
jgi:hypothetical protein